MSLPSFLAWLNRRNLVGLRAIVIYATLGLTWHSFVWATTFAHAALERGLSEVAIAAIIAAVTGPVTLLQGYVFKSYTDSRETTP